MFSYFQEKCLPCKLWWWNSCMFYTPQHGKMLICPISPCSESYLPSFKALAFWSRFCSAVSADSTGLADVLLILQRRIPALPTALPRVLCKGSHGLHRQQNHPPALWKTDSPHQQRQFLPSGGCSGPTWPTETSAVLLYVLPKTSSFFVNLIGLN